MPEYTEQDLQNAIVNVRNGVAVRTAATLMEYQEGHFVPVLMVPNLNVRHMTTNSGSRPIRKNILSNGFCGRRPSVTRQHTHKFEQSLAACLNNKVTTSP
jgi:hypothetical protein